MLPCIHTVHTASPSVLRLALCFFLGHDITLSALSNSIPRVVICVAIVKKSGLLCTEVSQGGFADILGCGAHIHLISFPMSSLHSPSPSPWVSFLATPICQHLRACTISLQPRTVEFSSDPQI
ncbi:hypothetical protein EDC04DRAFT_2632891 [Pisolithus marmoratus]|nr:hypothetical protein EDC04DRAFT_2632891 [Pisolithus marmoratus]